MRKNKIFKVIVSLVLVFTLGACSSNKDGEKSTGEKGDYSVALITSEGGLGDRSFNDSGNEGLVRAKEDFGIQTQVVEPRDVSEGETYLRQLAESGVNLIITMDLGHKDILESVAKEYPDTHFAIVNTIAEGDNISSIMFKEHEGAFLAGALSALVTTDSSMEKANPEPVISFIGGIDSPGINIFLTGFESGAHYINKDIKVLSAYSNSFSDPAKGKEIALSQIKDGSDIVFQAAGATGEGVFQAVQQEGTYAIGVDSDQDGIAPGFVLTSVMKRVDNAVYNMIDSGKNQSKYDAVYELGLKEEGVQLSPMTHTKDSIPSDYLKQVDQIKEDIISGKIVVEDTRK